MDRQTLLETFPNPIRVGTDGHVKLIDVMGDDAAVVQAARKSYGSGTKTVREDAALIDYLYAHTHTTPFEMAEIKLHVRVPMDVWRQWIRQRTACLGGNTRIQFDTPGGVRDHRVATDTIAELFRKWQPTPGNKRVGRSRQTTRRARIAARHIRGLNEDSCTPRTSRIVDVFESGIKPIHRATFSNGSQIECTLDHLFFTEAGWRTLAEVRRLHLRVWAVGATPRAVPPAQPTYAGLVEEWRPIPGWPSYAVSQIGSVKRVSAGRGAKSGVVKKPTVSRNRLVVSLSSRGRSYAVHVHRLVMLAFGQEPPGPEYVVCHLDGNAYNNHIDNLYWGTQADNASDRVKHGATTAYGSHLVQLLSVEALGEQMTYDLEVAGPWHNFSADGVIVHNSVNEYSTRYSRAIDAMARTAPDAWRLQATRNKQGSEGFLDEAAGAALSAVQAEFHTVARTVYQQRLDMGVAREQARMDLPLSTYTEAVWKIDLHNLLRFLAQRLDSHAQQEIREFAEAIARIVRVWVPMTWAAFEEHTLGGARLSASEIRALNNGTVNTLPPRSRAKVRALFPGIGEGSNDLLGALKASVGEQP